MACKNCTEPDIFKQITKQDGDFYIEAVGRSAWSLITPNSRSVTNLFRNGSFELPFDPDPAYGEWFPIKVDSFVSIGARRSTITAFSGVYSLEFYDIAQAQPPWLDQFGNLFPRTPGVTYHVSMMVKTCCGSTVRAGIFNASDGWIVFDEITGTGCWQQLDFSFAADIGPSLVSDIITSYLTITSSLQCTANFIDQITVVSSADGVTSPVIPFDGDSVGASWNGTSHASTSVMSANSRTLGVKTLLSDLSFDVISYIGHGVPPINQGSVQYARRNGASVGRARAAPRIITIVGELVGTSWLELEQKREALVNALGLRLAGYADCSDSNQVMLSYECVSNCGEVSGKELRIIAHYTGGLEGARQSPYTERITLSFTAYDDPMFFENRQYCKLATPGTIFTVNSCGNAFAPVRLFGRNRDSLTLVQLENLTTGHTVTFGGGAGYASAINSDLIFTNSPGQTLFVQKIAGVTTNLNAQMNVSSISKPSTFFLAPGANQIRVTGTIGAASEFVFCWRDKYLSTSASCGDCECTQP